MDGVRRIIDDYEAKLRPPAGRGDGRGKVEWERDGDGSEEFCARFKKLVLPDGARVEIRLDGSMLGVAIIDSGAGRLEFAHEKGDTVPKVTDGQLAEVVHGSVVILAGVFRPD